MKRMLPALGLLLVMPLIMAPRISLEPPPDLAVVMMRPPAHAQAGSVVTYHAVVTNIGGRLPGTFTVQGTAAGASAEVLGLNVTGSSCRRVRPDGFECSGLPGGRHVTALLRVRPRTTGALTVAVAASGDAPSPAGNNTARASTLVR